MITTKPLILGVVSQLKAFKLQVSQQCLVLGFVLSMFLHNSIYLLMSTPQLCLIVAQQTQLINIFS